MGDGTWASRFEPALTMFGARSSDGGREGSHLVPFLLLVSLKMDIFLGKENEQERVFSTVSRQALAGLSRDSRKWAV